MEPRPDSKVCECGGRIDKLADWNDSRTFYWWECSRCGKGYSLTEIETLEMDFKVRI